jgi:hypothetical protein
MRQDAVKIRVLAVDDHPPLREGISLSSPTKPTSRSSARLPTAAKRSNSSAGSPSTVRTGVGVGTEIGAGTEFELRVPAANRGRQGCTRVVVIGLLSLFLNE